MPNRRRPCVHPDCPNRYHMQQHRADSGSDSSGTAPIDPTPSGSRRLGGTYRATPVMSITDDHVEDVDPTPGHSHEEVHENQNQNQNQMNTNNNFHRDNNIHQICHPTPSNYGYVTSHQSNMVQTEWPLTGPDTNGFAQPCPLLYRVTEESTIFRQPHKAAGQFCANSYVGWHQNKRAIGYEQSAPLPTYNQNLGTGYHQTMPAYHNSQYQYGNSEYSINGSNRGNSNGNGNQVCFMPQSHTPSTAPDSMDSSCSGWHMNKWKLTVLLLVLLIIVSVLVALTIAVAAQVRTHSSLVKLVRQYTAEITVLDGDLMELNADLLDRQSALYKRRANEFTQILDQIFMRSSINAVYESVEVEDFRFLYDLPALQVNFLVKTNVEAELSANEILNVLRQGVFRDVPLQQAVIDLPSILVEGHKWDDEH